VETNGDGEMMDEEFLQDVYVQEVLYELTKFDIKLKANLN